MDKSSMTDEEVCEVLGFSKSTLKAQLARPPKRGINLRDFCSQVGNKRFWSREKIEKLVKGEI